MKIGGGSMVDEGVQNPKPDDEHIQKRVVYYSALLDAWRENRMETDKSLLTLSAGGIGLLVTLLSTNATLQIVDFVLCGIALFFFVITISCCIAIFKLNPKHIENTLDGKKDDNLLLKRLDRYVVVFFLHGLVFSMLFGFVNASHKFIYIRQEGMTMAKQNDAKDADPSKAKDSVSGIGQLDPDRTKSSGNTTKSSQRSTTDTQTKKN